MLLLLMPVAANDGLIEKEANEQLLLSHSHPGEAGSNRSSFKSFSIAMRDFMPNF